MLVGQSSAQSGAVAGMLGIADLALADMIAETENVVTESAGLIFEAVEDPGKKLMRQALFDGGGKENTEYIGAMRLQSAGGGVRHIAQRFCRLTDLQDRPLADVRRTVQSLACRRQRHAAVLGDLLECNHAQLLLVPAETLGMTVKMIRTNNDYSDFVSNYNDFAFILITKNELVNCGLRQIKGSNFMKVYQ